MTELGICDPCVVPYYQELDAEEERLAALNADRNLTIEDDDESNEELAALSADSPKKTRARGKRAGKKVAIKQLSKQDGFCYVHLVPRNKRQEMARAGPNPTVETIMNYDSFHLPGRRLTLEPSGSKMHVTPTKGWRTHAQLTYLQKNHADRKVGGFDERVDVKRAAFEEENLADIAFRLAETDEIASLIEHFQIQDYVPEVVEEVYEEVETKVGGAGDCWKSLVMLPREFVTKEFFAMPTTELLKYCRRVLEAFPRLSKNPVFLNMFNNRWFKPSIQADGDLHIDAVGPKHPDHKEAMRAEGWMQFMDVVRWLKEHKMRKQLVGKDALAPFDEAMSSMMNPEVQRATQALRQQQLAVSNQEIERICPWHIPVEARHHMAELAIPGRRLLLGCIPIQYITLFGVGW